MDSDPAALLAAAVTRNGHINRTPGRGKQAPERGGAAMAHDGVLTARQGSGQALPFESEPGVADRVHTAMKAVQPSGLGALRDRVVAKPGCTELR